MAEKYPSQTPLNQSESPTKRNLPEYVADPMVIDQTESGTETLGLVTDQTEPMEDQHGPVADQTEPMEDQGRLVANQTGLVIDQTKPMENQHGLVADQTGPACADTDQLGNFTMDRQSAALQLARNTGKNQNSSKNLIGCPNPRSPESFSQTYFLNNPLINTEGHITLNLLPVYRYGHPLSNDTKISCNH